MLPNAVPCLLVIHRKIYCSDLQEDRHTHRVSMLVDVEITRYLKSGIDMDALNKFPIIKNTIQCICDYHPFPQKQVTIRCTF